MVQRPQARAFFPGRQWAWYQCCALAMIMMILMIMNRPRIIFGAFSHRSCHCLKQKTRGKNRRSTDVSFLEVSPRTPIGLGAAQFADPGPDVARPSSLSTGWAGHAAEPTSVSTAEVGPFLAMASFQAFNSQPRAIHKQILNETIHSPKTKTCGGLTPPNLGDAMVLNEVCLGCLSAKVPRGCLGLSYVTKMVLVQGRGGYHHEVVVFEHLKFSILGMDMSWWFFWGAF